MTHCFAGPLTLLSASRDNGLGRDSFARSKAQDNSCKSAAEDICELHFRMQLCPRQATTITRQDSSPRLWPFGFDMTPPRQIISGASQPRNEHIKYFALFRQVSGT
jgi:hypothetical protein